MRNLAVLALLSLTALAFAGCSDDTEGSGDDVSSSSSSSSSQPSVSITASASASATSTTSSSTSTSQAPPANRAPSGSITVLVNGTLATFTLSGSDPDQDTLVWDLDFGDGEQTSGTELPSTVEHTYGVGLFTANLTLTDGQDPVTYSAPVTVTAPDTGSAFAYGGSVTVPCAQCTLAVEAAVTAGAPVAPIPSVSWASGEQGVDSLFVELPADLVGRDFVITTSATDAAGAALTSCDPTAAAAIELFDDESGPETGTIPAGTVCILLWEFPPVGAAPSGADLVFAIV